MTIHNTMTPDQQRAQTLMANFERQNLHKKCPIQIKQAGPHWGRYCGNPKCRKTGSWIDWIKKDQVRAMLKKDINTL